MTTESPVDPVAELRQQLADRDQQIATLTAELARWKKAPHIVAVSHQDVARELRDLLRDCQIALNDWLHTYAHELCLAEQVRASAHRIFEQGGTIAYIARLQDRLRRAGISPDLTTGKEITTPDNA